MQWLIDIIKEWIVAQGYALQSWVQAQGYLTKGFVDRGDPAAVDFAKTDLIIDSAWHTLDLSGIVDENARAVSLYALAMGNLVSYEIWFRKAGNTNEINVSSLAVTVANVPTRGDLTVPLSADGKIEYKISVITWAYIYIIVKGWWF